MDKRRLDRHIEEVDDRVYPEVERRIPCYPQGGYCKKCVEIFKEYDL